jgi:hypothetical protein
MYANFLELRKPEVQHSPDRARTAGEGMRISSGIMCWCTRPQHALRGGREEGIGHRGGVLRGLIQDPASRLRRILLLGTSVNRP